MSAASRAEVEGVNWDPPNLDYDFWSKQLDLLEAANSGEYDIVAGLGGYGSGKTIAGARWLISNALAEAGSKHLGMGIDYRKADETTYETFFKQLPGEGTHIFTSNINGPERSPIVKDYNRDSHRVTFVNNSIILLGSADYIGRHAGDEFGSIWLDEPSHYHPNDVLYDLALEMLPTRLRAHDRILCQLWTLTGNGYNAAWKILDQRENASGESIQQEVKIVNLPTPDNPYLDSETQQRLRRQYAGSGKEDQALWGGFDAAEGLVYNVRRPDHLIRIEWFEEEIEDPETGESCIQSKPAAEINGRLVPIDESYRVYGYDPGYTDPRVCLEIGRTIGDQDLVIIDEFYRRGVHLKELGKWLSGRVPGVIAADHDPAEIERLNERRPFPDLDIELRHEAIEANKAIDDGISEVSERFNPRDPDTGERLPAEHIRLYINEELEHTINELFSYKEENIGGTDTDDHAMDSMRYGVKAVADGDDALGEFGFGTLEFG